MEITTSSSINVNAAGFVGRLAIPGSADWIFEWLVIGKPFHDANSP
jgi:hypothetical protein